MAALQRNMKRRSVVKGIYREDAWEYPDISVREALVNALVHRDLSPAARGSPVQVMMFPDRLSIVNPGGLFGPVSVDRLGETGISATRNQVLMKLLEDTSCPGESHTLCENRGSGIGAKECSRWFLVCASHFRRQRYWNSGWPPTPRGVSLHDRNLGSPWESMALRDGMCDGKGSRTRK